MQQCNGAWRKCFRAYVVGAYLKNAGRFCLGCVQHCAEIKIMGKDDVIVCPCPFEKLAVWGVVRAKMGPMFCLESTVA